MISTDEAIIHLTALKKSDSLKYHPDLRDAVQLGKKALEHYAHCHSIGCDMAAAMLPGETEE